MKQRRNVALVLAAWFSSVALACGGGGSSSSASRDAWVAPPVIILLPDAGKPSPKNIDAGHGGDATVDAAVDSGTDARIDAAVDAGVDTGVDAPPAPYPAFSVEVPQVVNYGGPVLKNAQFVPVVFPGETLTQPIQSFMSAFGASQYWATVGAEYGVGPATSTSVIVETTAVAATITDTEIQAFLAQSLATDPRFPAPSPYDGGTVDGGVLSDVVYVLFYPEGVTVNVTGLGSSCTDFGGYHYSFNPSTGVSVPYIVVPRCTSFNELSGIDFVTAVTSHELIEAATDPDVYNPANLGTDVDHFIWELVLGDGEVGDMCSFLPEPYIHPAEASMSAYLVQRIWSNQAAAAYQDPCVPATGETVYFNTVPETTEISFVDQGQTYQTLGNQIPIGNTQTVTLDLFSNASTGGPWTVQLWDYGAAFNNPTVLDLQIVGASSGANGQKLTVQVKPLSAGSATLFGLSPYFIYSQQGNVGNFWVGAISN